ncbi:MAG: hypothetical protein GVY18_03495 [Bacteroidetes bacterium]|jgi:hypothetical protein|nr:hypothetical protein [Bacteroidota bacterium]
MSDSPVSSSDQGADRSASSSRWTAAVRALGYIVGGFVLGAAFGVAFGALASVFEGGPELWTGVRESWAWFAGMGALMGLGIARVRYLERRA